MAKQVAIKAKQIGAAYQKFKPFRPLCNQRDEQCSNKNAERRAPRPGQGANVWPNQASHVKVDLAFHISRATDFPKS